MTAALSRRLRRRVVLCALLPVLLLFRPAGWTTALEAQSGGQGRVHDLETGAAIAGARVEWRAASIPEGMPATATAQLTDAGGGFRVGRAWGPGGRIVISALGYRRHTLSWPDAEANDWRIGLNRDPLALDGIVVTAGGPARLRSEVAIPIESVEATEIEAAGAPSVDRLLNELPSVQANAGVPTGADLFIRGLGGARVLVLLDGRPAPGSLIENRDLGRMSLAGIERVEVVKGPLSSRYGSDALGGVVNLITRPPSTGFRLDGRVLSGDAGRWQAEAGASGGGRLRYRATGAWRQENELAGVGGSGGDPFARIWDLRSELRFEASADWTLEGGLNLVRERQRWPVGGGFSGFNDNRGVAGWLEARRQTGSGQWKTAIFVQDYDHLYRSARGRAPIATDEDPQWEREAIAMGAFAAAPGNHRIDLGVEGSLRRIRSPDKLVEERVGDTQWALFAQDAWLLGRTTLTGGARLTWNSRWGSNLSPSFGVIRRMGDDLRLRGTVAGGFRAPSFKELSWHFVNPGGGYVLQGFPELEPERSWNLSGGVEWNPRPEVRIDLEGYWNRVQDLIEPGFVGNTPSGLLVYSPRNLADVTTRGIEAGVRVVTGRVAVVAGYAWLDARSPDSDTPLDRRSPHSARLRSSWEADPSVRLRLDATLHLTGEAPLAVAGRDGRIVRAGTRERLVALDLQGRVALWRELDAIIGIDNLFDARPAEWQGPIGRRFRIGATLSQRFLR